MKNNVLSSRIISASVIAAMSAGMLAGCGSSAATTASSAAPAASSAASTAAASTAAASTSAAASGTPVNINVTRATFNLGATDDAETKAVQDAINAYIGPKINVQITLNDYASGEFPDKANMAVAAGETNLLWTASWEQAVDCDDLVKQNAVYDLTDLIKGSTLEGTMPEGIWKASQYSGKDYFVPCYKESAEGYDVMFRKDLADKYKWDLTKVTKLADIEPMLADCKKEGLKYPYLTQKTAMFHRYGLDDFDFFSQDSLMGVDRSTDEVVDIVTTDQYKEFCTLMCKWADEGYISEDDATKTTTDTTTQTQDWGISWWTDVPNNAEASTRYTQDVEMAHVTKNWAHSTTTLGSCFCVTSNSTAEQAKACVDFLGLLYTDNKLADLYTFGIEGTDYDKDSDGFVVKKTDAKYNHSAWESGDVEDISIEKGEPKDKVDLYKTFNTTCETSKAAGFRFDKSKVEDKYTACLSVFDQYGFILENGGFSEKEVEGKLAEYQKALDAAGYQDVLKEAQTQYDAWKASNK